MGGSPCSTFSIRCGDRILHLDQRVHVMGVLNVTPDSFSDGGRFMALDRALEQGERMVSEGADVLDVGGESSRPGADPVPVEEEMRRVLPVIEALAKWVSVPISVDTYKADVAERAIEAGASLINDISALRFDPRMAIVAATSGVPVVLMHMLGTPEDMQIHPSYEDVIGEISVFLGERVEAAVAAGIERSQLIVDPGIGFGKRVQDNVLILQRLHAFSALNRPILLGPSRKSFIGRILNLPVEERLEGTAAAVALSVSKGVHIVRVHDVKEMVRVVRMAEAIERNVDCGMNALKSEIVRLSAHDEVRNLKSEIL